MNILDQAVLGSPILLNPIQYWILLQFPHAGGQCSLCCILQGNFAVCRSPQVTTCLLVLRKVLAMAVGVLWLALAKSLVQFLVHQIWPRKGDRFWQTPMLLILSQAPTHLFPTLPSSTLFLIPSQARWVQVQARDFSNEQGFGPFGCVVFYPFSHVRLSDIIGKRSPCYPIKHSLFQLLHQQIFVFVLMV